MARLFIFGLGYTAKRIKAAVEELGWQVDATGSDGNVDFDDVRAVEAALLNATHVLSSVPPDRKTGSDPVLERYYDPVFHVECAAEGSGGIHYLSSTGVYGDAGGAWVDEATPTVFETKVGRRNARAKADHDWLEMGGWVYRLPGIYGPGRSALDRVRDGKARRIDLPGQVFSRVHVDDIVGGVVAGLMSHEKADVYNLGDDLPASGNAVTEHACQLLGIEPPPLETLEEANLSEMARGFYAENRRVANGKAKRVLGWQPEYPTYVEGIQSLL